MTKIQEIFKPITGFGNYEISNLGNVKSLRRIAPNNQPIRERILKPGTGTNGYKYVVFRIEGKSHTKYIHRLVGLHFIENPKNYNQINHKDGDKFNNRVSNLEWCNQSHNMLHAIENGLCNIRGHSQHSSKLTEDDVREIRRLKNSGMLQYKIAEQFGICPQTLSNIIRGKIWKWLN